MLHAKGEFLNLHSQLVAYEDEIERSSKMLLKRGLVSLMMQLGRYDRFIDDTFGLLRKGKRLQRFEVSDISRRSKEGFIILCSLRRGFRRGFGSIILKELL